MLISERTDDLSLDCSTNQLSDRTRPRDRTHTRTRPHAHARTHARTRTHTGVLCEAHRVGALLDCVQAIMGTAGGGPTGQPTASGLSVEGEMRAEAAQRGVR
mmetsp:Transcript_14328/g.28808  ORF Transcript_14328/g.28808 Transcript_14328/m.28808 type:complete len:102 (+) Transcript_14328:899-1204(+)